MADKRDRTKVYIGTRLALLRKEKGLTQGEFCQEFTDFCDKGNCILIPTVSSWEQNHRVPPMDVIIALAQYYSVSIDYLFGITDERNNTGGVEKQKTISDIIKHSDAPIKKSDLIKYNGLPVFVRFKKHTHLSQWGILNYNSGRVSCKDFVVSLSVDVDCYSYAVQTPIRTQITSFQQLLDTKYVWIEMITSDPEIEAKYNGRYIHNEDNTVLVNMSNSLTLRNEGLDVSFWAFRG